MLRPKERLLQERLTSHKMSFARYAISSYKGGVRVLLREFRFGTTVTQSLTNSRKDSAGRHCSILGMQVLRRIDLRAGTFIRSH